MDLEQHRELQLLRDHQIEYFASFGHSAMSRDSIGPVNLSFPELVGVDDEIHLRRTGRQDRRS